MRQESTVRSSSTSHQPRVRDRSTSASRPPRVDRRDRGEPAQLLPECPHDTVPGWRGRGQLQPLGNVTQILPTPVRVYDSRLPNSLGTPALESNSTTVVDLTPPGVGSMPPGATAALVNITATDVRAAGFATVYSNLLPGARDQHDQLERPRCRDHDHGQGRPATGNVKVTIGPDGGTDLIIDVLGYFGSGGIVGPHQTPWRATPPRGSTPHFGQSESARRRRCTDSDCLFRRVRRVSAGASAARPAPADGGTRRTRRATRPAPRSSGGPHAVP